MATRRNSGRYFNFQLIFNIYFLFKFQVDLNFSSNSQLLSSQPQYFASLVFLKK